MKSALWESNPPVQLGRLTPLPIGQGHMFLFKAEAVGLEPTTGVSPAPAFEAGSSSSRMTSIHVQAAETGIEPVPRRLTAACPYQHGLHRNVNQSAWSDLNRGTEDLAMAGALVLVLPKHAPRSLRTGARLSHTLKLVRGVPRTTLHPVGVEPTHPPWRDGTLPLRHRCS